MIYNKRFYTIYSFSGLYLKIREITSFILALYIKTAFTSKRTSHMWFSVSVIHTKSR